MSSTHANKAAIFLYRVSKDSKASRDAMESQHNPDVAEIIRSAAPFCEIRPLGEFEDPEWVVNPPTGVGSQ